MAIPSGLSAQLGIAEETTYGTAVTVTRFYEFNSESIKQDIARIESQGLRAGTRVQRSDRWAAGSTTIGGALDLELHAKSMGLWFDHMVDGTPATSNVEGSTYTHTYEPGDLPTGGLTLQVGRPDGAGTVQPFTYTGVRIVDWSLAANLDEIVKLGLNVVAQAETDGIALATASYPASDHLLVFTGASLTIAGSAVSVKSFELQGTTGLKTDRRGLGSAAILEPSEQEMRTYGGTIDAYFENLTAYSRFVDGTEAALVLTMQGSAASTNYNYGVVVTMNVRFDGETPEVGGPEELAQSLPFKAVDTATGASNPANAISIVVTNTDATP